MINPFDRLVHAEVREPGGYVVQRLAAGRLTSRVVHRFWVEVGWLWLEPLPSTLARLREIFAGN